MPEVVERTLPAEWSTEFLLRSEAPTPVDPHPRADQGAGAGTATFHSLCVTFFLQGKRAIPSSANTLVQRSEEHAATTCIREPDAAFAS